MTWLSKIERFIGALVAFYTIDLSITQDLLGIDRISFTWYRRLRHCSSGHVWLCRLQGEHVTVCALGRSRRHAFMRAHRLFELRLELWRRHLDTELAWWTEECKRRDAEFEAGQLPPRNRST